MLRERRDETLAQAAELGLGVEEADRYLAPAAGRHEEIYPGLQRVLRDFDFLISATTPVPPFPHSDGKGGVDVVNVHRVRHPGLFFHRLTEPPTHAGLPAVSMPCGFTSEGLPVGLQIVGRPHADADLLATAAAFEEIAPWWQHHPTTAA